MNVEQLSLRRTEPSSVTVAYARIRHLVELAADDGVLTREEDECIVAAMIHRDRPTAEMCGLFRQLQEQVWNGELTLEGRYGH